MTRLSTERLILLSFALALGAVIVAATTLNATRKQGLGADGSSAHWKNDIFHLPPEVPFPGKNWLARVADDTTQFTSPVDGQTYSSAYEAMVGRDPLQEPCRNMNAWLNSIFFSPHVASQVIAATRNNVEWAHYALCYLRNFIGAMVVYYGTAGIFHFFCYVHPMSSDIFSRRVKPTSETMWDQIRLAQLSMILYVMLPVVDEFLIEQGWTRVYYTIAEIGGAYWYAFYMALYFCLVEIGIYWMHRTLHTNKFLYKHIHLMHHKYNSPQTLTPWASIAFHPLDGILQASPYVLVMFVCPCHYLTHFGLLFFTAIWATYIHDAMDWNVWPIMGSKYHTIHHTHYIYNYGQVFVFCDRIWGTFREPSGPTGVVEKNGSQSRRTRPVTARVGNGKSKHT